MSKPEGDVYNVNNAGAVGRHARVGQVNFAAAWDQTKGRINLTQLARNFGLDSRTQPTRYSRSGNIAAVAALKDDS